MLHPGDPNSGSSQRPAVSADGFSFALVRESFAVETPPFATAYERVPAPGVGAHSWLSPGSADDWTVAPATLVIFIALTAVAIPLFIYRLALRFGCIRHPKSSSDRE